MCRCQLVCVRSLFSTEAVTSPNFLFSEIILRSVADHTGFDDLGRRPYCLAPFQVVTRVRSYETRGTRQLLHYERECDIACCVYSFSSIALVFVLELHVTPHLPVGAAECCGFPSNLSSFGFSILGMSCADDVFGSTRC